ncbi:deoxynucleotide monophosphate kinase family protein [Streptomyces bauhiniae]
MAYYRHVGLIGKARVGKDTVAAMLGQRFGYERVAFADTLKTAALASNPIIGHELYADEVVPVHLAIAVRTHGWDYVKQEYPEARRFLQSYGQTVREVDPGFWIRAAWPAMDAITARNLPVVVSDVRYENEADHLRRAGYLLIRVVRHNDKALTGEAARHPSETELDSYPADVTISNAGTLKDLHNIVSSLKLDRR